MKTYSHILMRILLFEYNTDVHKYIFKPFQNKISKSTYLQSMQLRHSFVTSLTFEAKSANNLPEILVSLDVLREV